MFWGKREARVIGEMLNEVGIEHDLASDAYKELAQKSPVEAQKHFSGWIDKLVAALPMEEVYHRAQAKGLLWASVRYPEENMVDPHFQARGTFQAIHHPELGRDLQYPVSVGTNGKDRVTVFQHGAPHLGEHTQEVLSRVGVSESEIRTLRAEGAL
jgi:crotonobetainyl-CoA:carnitine CoA-transferase CaiB-like acyl-CoA transferase